LTRLRRATAATIAAAALLALTAGTAQAIAWTPLDSTTAEEIAAVEYHPDGRIWFATTGGKVYRRATAGGAFTQEASVAATFSDIAFDSTGTVGLATADTGKLYRSANGGDSWSLVALSGYDHECPDSGPNPSAPVTGNLLSVAWGSDTTAWVVSDQRGQIMRSTTAGAAGTWSDASRTVAGACKIDAFVTDVAPVAGSVNDVYFVDENFATVWRTSDGLTSSAAERATLVNCFGITMKLAVDPASPNRLAAAGPCTGSLHWGFSSDSASTSEYVDGSATSRIRDLDAGPGVFLAVGDAGLIEQSIAGTTASSQPAGGVLATRDWRAVDFADASRAVVAGLGGALAITDQANVPPPVPAGPTPPAPRPRPDVAVPTVGGTSIGRGSLTPGQGTTFGFNTSEAGMAVLTFEKRFAGLKGKRKGKPTCLPKTKKRLRALRKQADSQQDYAKLLRRKSCQGYQRIGAIRQQVKAGRNTIAFNGRVAGRKLSKGHYRAKLRITDAAGNTSRAETIKFKVVAKKKARG
jgi:hypothetical protein